jgi:hypothetical protein
MEPKYATLKTIYEIVKNEANPITYNCTPAQVILRQSQPWDNIMRQLDDLATEALITIQKPRNSICITAKGMEKSQMLDVIARA